MLSPEQEQEQLERDGDLEAATDEHTNEVNQLEFFRIQAMRRANKIAKEMHKKHRYSTAWGPDLRRALCGCLFYGLNILA